MKSIKIVLFFFLLTCLGLSAQKTNTKHGPEIVFENTRYDYGEILVGSPGRCEFKFRNNGELPLVLTNVQASCGCTVPQWSKEPVQAGKTGVIKIKYNTRIPGTFLKTITVSSTAKNSMVILSIKGKVTLK